MKKLTLLVALITLSAFAFQAAFSQSHVVSINVNSVQKLAVTGTPSLTIDNTLATAGNDVLGDATDATGSYSITHNGASGVKITAGITVGGNFVLGASLLKVKLAAIGGGTSDGDVNLSTTAAEVENSIGKGGFGPGTITYTLSGVKASDGMLTTTRTVTFTITN